MTSSIVCSHGLKSWFSSHILLVQMRSGIRWGEGGEGMDVHEVVWDMALFLFTQFSMLMIG